VVRLVASADSHVATSSESAVDQDILGLEAIFSLNWESYWSHAYGWNLRLDLAMKAWYWKSCEPSLGLKELRTPA